ncbi:hypothetical protein OU995_09845 [Roseateles sp. SL47]|uniref:hypothetical protein n=1 Tax=Roseateles sp. SL47 TaxID=2995138 RepID=UPI002271EEEF|nr:hypothetical protein [Roseateles sp. SL47]WAC74967.1 hypothetical protein OU995_09845 [Roseateles sp. SL47]
MNERISSMATFAFDAIAARSRGMFNVSSWMYVMGLNVALQAPFWILKNFYSFQRPIFNEDLMLAVLLFSIGLRLGWLVLAAVLVVDVVRIASLNYHFLNVADFVGSVRFVSMMNLAPFLTWAALLLAVMGVLYLFALAQMLKRWRAPMAVIQVVLIAGVLLADGMNGSMQMAGIGRDNLREPFNVGGSPVWNLYKMQQAGVPSQASGLQVVPSHVRDSILQWHASQPSGSILLVLVESMGEPVSPQLRDWLARQIQSPRLRQRWRFTAGTERFYGSTTHGELRVLCGLDGSYEMLDATNSHPCLPHQLGADEFTAMGYHGFQLSMFDRNRWWGVAGLQAHHFDYQRSPAQVKDCHAVFHGICDREVLHTAIASVQKPRRLAYVVTLDTHLPLSSRSKLQAPELAALCVQADVSEASCALTDQLGALLRDMANQLEESAATPYVAVVGDHAPPFIRTTDRQAFLTQEIPYLLLEPQDESQQRSTAAEAP